MATKKPGRPRSAGTKRPAQATKRAATRGTATKRTAAERGRAKAGRAPAPRPKRAGYTITLLTRNKSWEMRADAPLKAEAMYWAYVARRRSRWLGVETEPFTPLHRLLGDDAREAFEEIGSAGLVEVRIPWIAEEVGWEARVMPWEYLLSKATKSYRREKLVAVRHLAGHLRADLPVPLDQPVLIGLGPPAAGEGDPLRADIDRLKAALRRREIVELLRPGQLEAHEVLSRLSHPVVHVTGEDNHVAVDRLGLALEDVGGKARLDGLPLRGRNPQHPAFLEAQEVADLVAGGKEPPALVVYSVFNSAARIAPLTVANGAGAAIGVQDSLEDALAGVFTSAFWRALRQQRGQLLEAFREALETVRRQPASFRGAGLVLWSACSLVQPPAAVQRELKKAADLAKAQPAAIELRPPHERVVVEAQPPDAIHYSLLHNRRPLFDRLSLRNTGDRTVSDVDVNVVLYVGPDSFPFRRTVKLQDAEIDLAPEVVVPLTSSLIRTASERMQSTLFLEVTQGHGPGRRVIERRTWRVMLEPVDLWLDTDEDRLWLPSFVLPRDPAVSRIVESARRYLCAIADDPGAGFDGYQSVLERGGFEKRHEPVDAQVRAIWTALLHEWRLGYINPPPSYSESGQRLRTPSDILGERQGTCIDLTLLLAACLEYVDIWPVVFLLEGHAFPGYWRSEEVHEKWRSMGATRQTFESADPIDPALRAGTPRDRLTGGYVLPKSGFFEVTQLVREGWLVPLESVWLTNQSSFTDARDEGRVNLTRKSEFHSMIDVNLARGREVTPLPILDARPNAGGADGR